MYLITLHDWQLLSFLFEFQSSSEQKVLTDSLYELLQSSLRPAVRANQCQDTDLQLWLLCTAENLRSASSKTDTEDF